MKNNPTIPVAVLLCSALVMALVHLNLNPQPASAETAVVNKDFQLVTARTVRGDDSLYVLDNRTGLLASFVWNPTTRRLEARDVRPIADVLGNAPLAN